MSEPQELEFEVKVRNPENSCPESARGYVAIDGKKIQDFELEPGKELNIPFKASLEDAEHTFEVHHTYSPDPQACLLYTSPSPRDKRQSRMPSSA